MDKLDIEEFGQRIKQARKNAGITQHQLASHLGIGKNALSRYELGKVDPQSSTLRNIATYLQVSADWLLTGKEKKPRTLYVPTYSETEERFNAQIEQLQSAIDSAEFALFTAKKQLKEIINE
ncbi:MAG: helix-turn-helix domain-containing protein [Neptuniibacter sp.]